MVTNVFMIFEFLSGRRWRDYISILIEEECAKKRQWVFFLYLHQTIRYHICDNIHF